MKHNALSSVGNMGKQPSGVVTEQHGANNLGFNSGEEQGVENPWSSKYFG